MGDRLNSIILASNHQPLYTANIQAFTYQPHRQNTRMRTRSSPWQARHFYRGLDHNQNIQETSTNMVADEINPVLTFEEHDPIFHPTQPIQHHFDHFLSTYEQAWIEGLEDAQQEDELETKL